VEEWMTAPIAAARDAVATERSLVEAERDAFEAFDRRVADVGTVAASTSATPASTLLTDRRQSDRSLARVRAAYEETVMSVPHHDSEYGDTLAESLAADFGEQLAVALVEGSTLPTEVRDAVRAAASAARRERREFLDVLDREDASLTRTAEDLAAVRTDLRALDDRPLSTRSFDDLRRLWNRVQALDARTDGIAMQRQETLRSHRGELPGVPADLQEYLYADLSPTYPALAAIAATAADLRRARRRVERRLATTA
jgi:hypothetical protein